MKNEKRTARALKGFVSLVVMLLALFGTGGCLEVLGALGGICMMGSLAQSVPEEQKAESVVQQDGQEQEQDVWTID